MAEKGYTFGPFQLETRSRRLLRGRDVIPITVKAFDTLIALVDQAGRVVAKDDLMRRVWPDVVVEEANLSQQIFLLRKLLGEGPKDHQYIQTVPRRGYRFVANVTEEVTDHGDRADAIQTARDREPFALTPPPILRLSL